MAATFTTNLGLTLPARGDNINTWDGPVNGNFGTLDQRIGGSTLIDISGGSVGLTAAQMKFASIVVAGNFNGALNVILPQNIGGLYSFLNASGAAANVLVVVNGSQSQVFLPTGVRTLIFTDGATALLADGGFSEPPGVMLPFAGQNVPRGYLICGGQAVSRTTYAALFAAIGTLWGAGDGSTTFNVPDMRGNVPAGSDTMGGAAANRLTIIGSTVGLMGGLQQEQIGIFNLPPHYHAISDEDFGHAHSYNSPNVNNVSAGSGTQTANSGVQSVNTANSKTGIGNTDSVGGGQPFNIVQPTAIVYYIVKT